MNINNGPITAKLSSREFDRTLIKYTMLSKRDPKQICDTKAFFIARRATLLTPKADWSKARRQLMAGKTVQTTIVGQKIRITKTGRIIKGKLIAEVKKAPLIALMVNAIRGRKGEKGLSGPEMAQAVERFLGARHKSIAFLKSGWLPAIKILEPLAWFRSGAPRKDSTAKQIGTEKGSARPANEGWRAKSRIWNTADAKHDDKLALFKYGEPALEQAFEDERRSMIEHMEKKMKQTAERAGVKHK